MADLREKLLREKLMKLIRMVVVPYFAGEIADLLIANGVTFETDRNVGSNWKPKTNADRFRAMSDEDIAIWARAQIGCGLDYFPCGIVCGGDCNTYNVTDCQAKIINWLQQPAKEEN